jgi:hypothetical protein
MSPESATTGGGACDDSGDCQTCQSCAQSGPCASESNACVNNQECLDYGGCYFDCADPTCIADCASSYPTGSSLFTSYFQCVVCDACASDCEGVGSGC